MNRGEFWFAAWEGGPCGRTTSSFRCERSHNAHNCGISVVANVAMDAVPRSAVYLVIPINAGADLWGQVSGGASVW